MSKNPTSSLPSAFSTFIELLRWRSRRQPNRRGYTFLHDGETEESHLTYKQLDQQARSIGAQLQRLEATGKRVLLLYPPGLDYIAAFFGCLYAGAVAVPTYPPDPARLNRTLPRLQAIVADAQATIALTIAPILSMAELLFDQAPDLKAVCWLATDDITQSLEEWQEPAVNGDTLAFLQYTSGSTAAPRGVMLTHNNLLHNSALIHQCFGHTPASRGVIWLPPYHDMGLIGGILQPLYGGFPVTLLSPIDFLKQPLRWLRAISRDKATTSGGPNFAYDLCVRKITEEERTTLDLSSWQVAFNGAEPVRHETIERFAQAFAPCGFRREAFYPCYGLAEATLIVSGGLKLAPPVTLTVNSVALGQNRVEVSQAQQPGAQTLVGCGSTLDDQDILIVNPSTRQMCPPDQIGEIWVSGSSVAQGYWNRPEESAETFKAGLADDDKSLFLRTGDLGFVKDGELFVTGRLKDLIIIRGQNYYPQDIELTVEKSHPALRPGCCAAFSVLAAGEERLIVAQEVGRQATDTGDVIQAIRRAVAQEHELQVYGVLLLQAGTIPKTSSGKVQRHACRAGFLSDSLDIVAKNILDVTTTKTPPPQPQAHFIRNALMVVKEPSARQALLTLFLQEQAARILRIAPSQVDVQQSLCALGLDSLMAVELEHEVETSLGVALPVADFLQGPSVAQLVTHVLDRLSTPASASSAATASAQDTEAEPILSHGQRSMWFLHQLAPQSAAYNIASAVRIRGELDVPTLQRAFQALVDHHPSLRTTFSASHGEPAACIEDRVEVPFQVKDASALSEADLSELLAQEAHRPFDLEHGPLLRVHLFSRSTQEQVLLLVIHHIIADFWSLAVLVRELETLYLAGRTGAPVSPALLMPPCADYARRQADLLAGAEGQHLWAFWRQQLAGELPQLDLPTDRPRPPVQTYRGASEALKLNVNLTQKLKTLSQSNDATLYMTLLAGFQVLLGRYTGQQDILVGTPMAGRSRAEMADVIGYLVNPVALRAHLDGNLSFIEFLKQVRQTVLQALAHQDYAFDLLVEQLQPQRDPSRSPIFQVMFILQQTPLPERPELASFALGEAGARMDWGGLSLESVALERQAAQFDLTLATAETANGLGISLQYNSDLFEAETIKQILEHWQVLLESIVAQPEQKLAELAILTHDERQRLLVTWNDTRTDYPRDRCLYELFEAQAERTPDAAAVIWRDERLPYRELNTRANQLAHHLRKLGVRPETWVGVCIERSPDLVVSLLAVLKAGGAYVPLDPTYPHERLAWILDDTQSPIILTQQRLVGSLPICNARVVCLDTHRDEIAQECRDNPARETSAANLAYVLYTSGSTGRPKGIAITHYSVVALIEWAKTVFDPRDLAGVLASTSICFDLSVFELFVPLCYGGAVVLAENLLQFPDLTAAQEVTLVNTVPSAMAELLRLGSLPALVRTVNLAGEPLQNRLVQQLYKLGTVQRVLNLYGPTEDTTYSTAALIEREAETASIIGRPIDNTQVYVLNAWLEPAPVGVSGELCIGGAGLARGYLNRPDLTAERFIPNPFSAEQGARLYKTGDLVRYRSDGALEYIRRIDHQVKIRGFRIELGEIEAVLRGHPAVRESVVVAREDSPGDPSPTSGAGKRLVAYIVPRQPPGPGPSELRSLLKQTLPDYMVPSAFVLLAEGMPLTPNGKIDRRALPMPDQARPAITQTFIAPRTPMEQELAQIWGQVLKLDQVGIHDNFFELGGHSLLATQVISRARETLGVELPLHTLFEEPTVAGLAAKFEGQVGQNRQEVPRIRSRREQLAAQVAQLGEGEARQLLQEKKRRVNP